ncbi:MAG: CPBP family intramembrane metalloprotease [Lachnospiraceae bacterium]|nr:CPBP family intramembrane metalloprotease [Lachnospiraceae bacterium]
MFQYILFDLDGTLTDPKEGICKSVQYALKKAGIEENNLDKLEPFIGPPLLDSFREFYQMDEEAARQAVSDYRERFSVKGLYENAVYPGIDELLKKLKENGCRLAVASSKPQVFVEKILKHFSLYTYFDVIVGSELDGTRVAKEEVVDEALRRLYLCQKEAPETAKKKTVMVGDRKFDVEGARAAGIASVGVSYGYAVGRELHKAGADAVVPSVKHLQDYLLPGQKGSFWRSLSMLVPFAVFFLTYQLAGILGLSVIESLRAKESFAGWIAKHSDLAAALVGMLAFGGSIAVLWAAFRNTDVMRLHKSKYMAPGLVLAVTLSLGLNILIGYVVEYFRVYSEDYAQATERAVLPLGIGLLYYVLLSPLAEEMVFRWLLQGRIRHGLGKNVAIVTTALFFAFYHGNVPQGVYAFCMGLVLAVLYEWSGTFLMPLLFHIMANAAVYLMGYMPAAVCGIIVTPVGCVVLLAISAAIFGYIIKLRNRKETGKW